MSALNLVTAPTGQLITLDEVKRHLRVEVDDDDGLIQSYLEASVERAELETGRQLLTATWELWLNGFPGRHRHRGAALGSSASVGLGRGAGVDWGGYHRSFIDLPCAPLLTVVSITYVDLTGTLQTWSPSQYQVHSPQGPRAERGKIAPIFGVWWPVTLDQLDTVKVQFTAGYGTTGDKVPQLLRRAILLAAADLYENREGTVVTERRVTVQDLLWIDRIFSQFRARPIVKAAA